MRHLQCTALCAGGIAGSSLACTYFSSVTTVMCFTTSFSFTVTERQPDTCYAVRTPPDRSSAPTDFNAGPGVHQACEAVLGCGDWPHVVSAARSGTPSCGRTPSQHRPPGTRPTCRWASTCHRAGRERLARTHPTTWVGPPPRFTSLCSSAESQRPVFRGNGMGSSSCMLPATRARGNAAGTLTFAEPRQPQKTMCRLAPNPHGPCPSPCRRLHTVSAATATS